MPATPPIRIVICDDDPDELLFFQLALANMGLQYDVAWVESGADLIRYLTTVTTKPDLVFLDINMPGSPGLDALQEIRSNTSIRDQTVIIHSTSRAPDIVDAAFHLGANRYFVKTFSLLNLEHFLKQIILLEPEKLRSPDKDSFCITEPFPYNR